MLHIVCLLKVAFHTKWKAVHLVLLLVSHCLLNEPQVDCYLVFSQFTLTLSAICSLFLNDGFYISSDSLLDLLGQVIASSTSN